MNRKFRMLIALVAALCLLSGTAALAESKAELNVFAAASLTESLTKIADLYKAANPNVQLNFNFDSSGTLQTQG